MSLPCTAPNCECKVSAFAHRVRCSLHHTRGVECSQCGTLIAQVRDESRLYSADMTRVLAVLCPGCSVPCGRAGCGAPCSPLPSGLARCTRHWRRCGRCGLQVGTDEWAGRYCSACQAAPAKAARKAKEAPCPRVDWRRGCEHVISNAISTH